MQLRFFTIPLHGGEDATEELNRFLATHRISAIDRSFVQDGTNSAWALCVSFESAGERPPSSKRSSRIDYREVLNDQDFTLFARLRTLRKELANDQGIPAYAIMTNEQLAALVQRRVQNVIALREIPGIGESRIEKYGEHFLRILQEAFNESDMLPIESSDET